MRESEQTMRREEQQQKVQQSAKSHQLSASEQTRSCWLLKAALEHWDQRRYERSIDGQRGTLRTEIWTFFIHLRVGRRDRRMEHMLRCGCERYQIYSAMIGCNEINFHGKFIDTAKIESKRNLEARVQQQHMEGGRRTSSLHQSNLNPK